MDRMLSLPSLPRVMSGQRHGMEVGSGIRGTMPDPAPEKRKAPVFSPKPGRRPGTSQSIYFSIVLTGDDDTPENSPGVGVMGNGVW